MKNQRKRTRNSRLDPNLFVLEDLAIDTADTVVNTTILTNSLPTRMSIHMRGVQLTACKGSTAARVFWVLRRLPSGYTAPNVTISTGLTDFVDQPNILGFGFRAYLTTDTIGFAEWQWIHKNATLYEGDSLVLQCVPNTSSTNLIETGQLEFGSRFL